MKQVGRRCPLGALLALAAWAVGTSSGQTLPASGPSKAGRLQVPVDYYKLKNIREQKGYTYSPSSDITAHPGSAHWLEIADVTTGVTGASLKEIFAEIDRLRSEAPPPAELRGIQNFLAGLFVVRNASRAGVIGRLMFVDLYGLGDDYLSRYVARVLGVTPEEVRRIAREHLIPHKMTLVVVGDTKTVKDQLAPWTRGK